ncbi:DUF3422 domain-containing protein [Labrys sp. ZIDIC5]|uniref:DUF3422 domain-containing protein n=1 Tax=Labrys sedimenti TaxID=3106036 RepID=UPI002ACA8961|nr:DUF3422 domain-containing protein [Labrys sp. ZIDIC5]MDZ5448319.1 DUF3422 domain-containing protein [Labrys sp. ZIDIC5]
MTAIGVSEASEPPFVDHQGRAAIYAELHARPTEPIATSARIRRIAFMPADAGPSLEEVARRFALFAGQPVLPFDDARTRHIKVERGGRKATFELHNEFATLTWQSDLTDREPWPEDIGLDCFAGLQRVSATRVDLTETHTITEAALVGFNPISLCYSELYDGRAQVATDFNRDRDGFTRYELAAGQCNVLRRGVLVRRLLEIETYSNFVLLGLPVARALGSTIRQFEGAVSQVMGRVGHTHSTRENREALESIHALSAEVGRSIEETSFRFAASQAYAAVLDTRLRQLVERPIGEFTTIDRYLTNRTTPAVATCLATEKRLQAVAMKLERSAELLNAHISLSLETQNQTILDTISRTSESQYRLQETVEGLSIIAISYYALAIIGYMIEGVSHIWHVDKAIAMLCAAPVVLFLVWCGIKSLRKRAA